MARTRSNAQGSRGNNPPASTVTSALVIPPHSNYASQGGGNPVSANPVTQGTNPPNLDMVPYGSNPQPQVANAPLNTQGPGVQISTVVHPSRTGPDPLYGMSQNFGVGGSGHTQQPPPYIDGLAPLVEDVIFQVPTLKMTPIHPLLLILEGDAEIKNLLVRLNRGITIQNRDHLWSRSASMKKK